MLLKRLEVENFTVFKDLKVDFSNGINISSFSKNIPFILFKRDNKDRISFSC